MNLILDKRSHRPLYLQAVDYLVEQIHGGDLATGARVPSELELAEELAVSRTTARLAVDQLVRIGIVYREQGRGTFVAEPRMSGVQGFTSFSQDVKACGREPGSQVIRFGLRVPDPDIQAKLRIGPEEQALELVRLRTADSRGAGMGQGGPVRWVHGHVEVQNLVWVEEIPAILGTRAAADAEGNQQQGELKATTHQGGSHGSSVRLIGA